MADATPPIVIDGDGMFDVYPTIASACEWLEVKDVKDGLYKAFDSEGRTLRLVALSNGVSIEVPAASNPDPAKLERRLREHIQKVGVDRVGIANLEDAPLPMLLDALLRFQSQDSNRRKWSLRTFLRRLARR